MTQPPSERPNGRAHRSHPAGALGQGQLVDFRALPWGKLLAVAVLGATVFALVRWGPLSHLRTESGWMSLIESLRTLPGAPALVILVGTVLSATGLPITPMLLATGAIFGAWPGSLYCFAILVLGASLGFWLGRTALRDLAEQLVGERMAPLRRLLARRSFWNLVRVRFIPIPFLFANLGLALCNVRWRNFLTSTATAFLPIAILWPLLAGSLVQAGTGERSSAVRNGLVALALLFLVSFVPSRFVAWRRAVRYRRLRRERDQRRD